MTNKVIKDFISCFARDSEELYLSAVNETTCLKDATKYMKEQQKKIDELEETVNYFEGEVKELRDRLGVGRDYFEPPKEREDD